MGRAAESVRAGARRFVVVAACVAATVAEAQAVFHWVDAQGDDHYTNDVNAVPKRYRRQAEREAGAIEAPPVVDAGAAEPNVPGFEVLPPTNAAPRAARVTDAGQPPASVRAREYGTIVLDPISPQLEEKDAVVIRRAVEAVSKGAAFVWLGGLRQDVHVEVVESDAALAAHGAPAWAGGFAQSSTKVFLCGPSVGSFTVRPRPYELVLTHEVAHAVQLQLTGAARLPRWFTEGFAMYVAGDESAASLDDLAWFSHQSQGRPLAAAFKRLDSRAAVTMAYGISVYGFRALAKRTDEAGLVKVLEAIGEGDTLEGALARGAGVSLDELDASVARSLVPHYHERATAP